jgi:hypothetical protein
LLLRNAASARKVRYGPFSPSNSPMNSALGCPRFPLQRMSYRAPTRAAPTPPASFFRGAAAATAAKQQLNRAPGAGLAARTANAACPGGFPASAAPQRPLLPLGFGRSRRARSAAGSGWSRDLIVARSGCGRTTGRIRSPCTAGGLFDVIV